MSDMKLDEFQPTPEAGTPADGLERSAAAFGVREVMELDHRSLTAVERERCMRRAFSSQRLRQCARAADPLL